MALVGPDVRLGAYTWAGGHAVLMRRWRGAVGWVCAGLYAADGARGAGGLVLVGRYAAYMHPPRSEICVPAADVHPAVMANARSETRFQNETK